MKHYPISPQNDAPTLSLQLSPDILRDLTFRAGENGTTLNMEISIRLVRSLERDLAMIEEDNRIAYVAFQKVQADFGAK